MAITKVSPDLLDLDAGITITTSDNSTNLTLTSTDADANAGPNLDLYRNSSSPADSDLVGQINWFAENDADEKIEYAEIRAYTNDVSDGSESSAFRIGTWGAGTEYANTIMAKSGNVGINTTSPAQKLEIAGGYLKFSGGDYGIQGSASLTVK